MLSEESILRLLDTTQGLAYTPLTSKHSLGGVAQLVRAPACHAGGRGFESRHSRHFSSIKQLCAAHNKRG
jgi:hypothetical protein